MTPVEELLSNTPTHRDRKSTRLNSSHSQISYAVFCLKKKKCIENDRRSTTGESGKPSFRHPSMQDLRPFDARPRSVRRAQATAQTTAASRVGSMLVS